jgi:two-component system, NarL family, nitrate/nitrite response regulator NarL
VIRVAIVDDHPVARQGVEHIVATVPEVRVVASTASVEELEAALGGQGEGGDLGDLVDVVVLDLYLDGEEPALAAVERLAARTRVLVMSASRRPGDVLGAIRAGASGYLTKQSSTAMFVAAIQAVAAGGFSLSSKLADILQAELAQPAGAGAAVAGAGGQAGSGERRGRPVLSPREQEALGYIARGFTHAQTATRMGVTKATVDTYVERIRHKLQAGNKADLTRSAIELDRGAVRQGGGER